LKNPRVILFSPFFYPEAISTGKYNSVLAQALLEAGASVQVVCFYPSYPSWKPTIDSQEIPGITAHRAGRWVRYPRHTLLRRAVLEISFAWHAAISAFRLRREADVVVIVFPPSLASLFIQTIFPASVRRIGIVHDLQGILGLSDGGRFYGLLSRVVNAVEKRGFRSCDHLILLSRDMASVAKLELQLDEAKLKVCYPFTTIRNCEHSGSSLAQLFPSSARHVVYSGALGKKQNSYGLAELFRKAAVAIPDVHFHILSGGPIFEILKGKNSVQPISNLHFHDLVKESDLEELYLRSTVQVIPVLDIASNSCLPSKLPNILAAGCPVLAICNSDSELAHLLQTTGFAEVVPSWEYPQFLESLRKSLSLADRSTHEERRTRVKALLSSHFSLDALVSAVLDARLPAIQASSLESVTDEYQST